MPANGKLTKASESGEFGLTTIEKEIIALIVEGYTKKELMVKVGMGRQALRRRVCDICQRLGVENEFELVLFVQYHRLIELGGTDSYGARKLGKAAGV